MMKIRNIQQMFDIHVYLIYYIHSITSFLSTSYAEALRVQQQLMAEAVEEIDEYCSKSAWLNEIFNFCNGWNDESVLKWRGASGFVIEVSNIRI